MLPCRVTQRKMMVKTGKFLYCRLHVHVFAGALSPRKHRYLAPSSTSILTITASCIYTMSVESFDPCNGRRDKPRARGRYSGVISGRRAGD